MTPWQAVSWPLNHACCCRSAQQTGAAGRSAGPARPAAQREKDVSNKSSGGSAGPAALARLLLFLCLPCEPSGPPVISGAQITGFQNSPLATNRGHPGQLKGHQGEEEVIKKMRVRGRAGKRKVNRSQLLIWSQQRASS